ncbi:Mfsd6 [Symbiodinium pilosum]|uniref:Mfsd6 protein n=1 Tax=Symbiodinium pilosum TaxID=2952 RepID=A0A812LAL6_SYMPI|nr:Mfsd6 [Symbiodinium pilosum]
MGAFEKALVADAFTSLRKCVEALGEPCEGNIMHTWNSWEPQPDMEAKQRNLFHLSQSLSKRRHEPLLLEIGFNAGHSVCLMMLANPAVKVVAFDLCEHVYTKPCVEVLQSIFGRDRLQLVEGSSTSTLPEYHKQHPYVQFDMFHIDGGHQYKQARTDLENCCRMARKEWASIMVLDDTDITGVAAAWADFMAGGHLVERAPPHKLGRFRHGIGEVIPDGVSKCGGCGSADADWACGGCRQVRYCNESCGRSHWSMHRKVCPSRARQAPALACPSQQIVPSLLLESRRDGALLAVRDLLPGDVLFSEPPLAWQPAPAMRARLCARCGRAKDLVRCTACRQVCFCPHCAALPSPCVMCPELSITQGHVGAFTLVALEVLRNWEEGRLQSGALLKTSEVRAREQARHCTAAVQKVAHFCSAVRWSDERAEEVLAAVIGGRIEHTSAGSSVGVGYYPAIGRLRAGTVHRQASMGNVTLQLSPNSEHGFAMQAMVSTPIPEASALHLA